MAAPPVWFSARNFPEQIPTGAEASCKQEKMTFCYNLQGFNLCNDTKIENWQAFSENIVYNIFSYEIISQNVQIGEDLSYDSI